MSDAATAAAAAPENVRQFETGAVRSKDADDVRYDLITPIGLAAVARTYALGFGKDFPDHLPAECWIGYAKKFTYELLAGNHTVNIDGDETETLAFAAVCVCEAIDRKAIDREAGASRKRGPWHDLGCGYEDISPAALKAVAEAYKEGLVKYSAFNWEKGMPVWDLLNHGLRHLDLDLSGDTSEPHLGHALWNYLAALHSLEKWPHLNEGTLRGPGCTPPAEKPKPAPQAAPAPQQEPAAETVKLEDGSLWSRHGGLWKFLGYDSPPAPAKPKPHRIPAVAAFLGGEEGATAPVLYLSGPMSGIPSYNFPAFNQAAAKLRARGFHVQNPADFGANPNETWRDCLVRDLYTLGHSDILVQLPGWENSKGASLEFVVAEKLGLGIATLSEMLG